MMFEKYSSTKFNEIPSMRTDGQTDMTKLIVAFRNFAQVLKMRLIEGEILVVIGLTKHKELWDILQGMK